MSNTFRLPICALHDQRQFPTHLSRLFTDPILPLLNINFLAISPLHVQYQVLTISRLFCQTSSSYQPPLFVYNVKFLPIIHLYVPYQIVTHLPSSCSMQCFIHFTSSCSMSNSYPSPLSMFNAKFLPTYHLHLQCQVPNFLLTSSLHVQCQVPANLLS